MVKRSSSGYTQRLRPVLLRWLSQTGITADKQQTQNTGLRCDQPENVSIQHSNRPQDVQPIVAENRQIAVNISVISIKPDKTAST